MAKRIHLAGLKVNPRLRRLLKNTGLLAEWKKDLLRPGKDPSSPAQNPQRSRTAQKPKTPERELRLRALHRILEWCDDAHWLYQKLCRWSEGKELGPVLSDGLGYKVSEILRWLKRFEPNLPFEEARLAGAVKGLLRDKKITARNHASSVSFRDIYLQPVLPREQKEAASQAAGESSKTGYIGNGKIRVAGVPRDLASQETAVIEALFRN